MRYGLNRAVAVLLALSACSPVPPAAPAEARREAPPPPTPAPDEGPPSAPRRGAPTLDEARATRPGDIIFHVSRSAQSEAIQRATGSRYSHVGLVESGPGGLVVLEAVQPVKRTPLAEWIARGVDGHFVVKRLARADALLTPAAIEQLQRVGSRFVGKRYDMAFGWSDARIYCSELVYKVYHEALGIEVGRIQQLREFDLDSPVVRAALAERYGSKIPLDEPVVSPAAIFDSPALITVREQ